METLKEKHTLIITGGVSHFTFLQQCWKTGTFDYVIAVDGALCYVEEANIPIDCLVGDFDTVNSELLQKYMQKEQLYIEKHRPEKDETDTELALRIAMKQGSKHITIVGATGGRLDHFIGNLHMLLQPLKNNISCVLVDPWNRIRLVDSYWKFSKENQFGTYISFLPFTDEVHGISLVGFKYPLCNASMKKGNTLGVSNERMDDVAEVFVKKGILICIESRDVRL